MITGIDQEHMHRVGVGSDKYLIAHGRDVWRSEDKVAHEKWTRALDSIAQRGQIQAPHQMQLAGCELTLEELRRVLQAPWLAMVVLSLKVSSLTWSW
jgi:hypothetical protein